MVSAPARSSEVCTVSNGIGVAGAPDELLVHDRGVHALSTYQWAIDGDGVSGLEQLPENPSRFLVSWR